MKSPPLIVEDIRQAHRLLSDLIEHEKLLDAAEQMDRLVSAREALDAGLKTLRHSSTIMQAVQAAIEKCHRVREP